MSKEPGPREKALREMREAKYDNRFAKMDPKRVRAAVEKAMVGAGLKKPARKKKK